MATAAVMLPVVRLSLPVRHRKCRAAPGWGLDADEENRSDHAAGKGSLTMPSAALRVSVAALASVSFQIALPTAVRAAEYVTFENLQRHARADYATLRHGFVRPLPGDCSTT